jgi:hypothetical protein
MNMKPAASPAWIVISIILLAILGINTVTGETTPDSPTQNATAGTEYQREAFPHWSDLDGDGCGAREETLTRDVVETGNNASECSPTTGLWVSPYDNKEITKSSEIDIDHIVPLKEAWLSGADQWSEEQREEFANDPENLLAVSAGSNRSKGAQDPSTWMPPAQEYRCTYAQQWVQVKEKYELSIDAAEQKKLENACG